MNRNIPQIPDYLKGKIFPYQEEHVNGLIYSIKTYGRGIDGSDTGTGTKVTLEVFIKNWYW